MADILLAFKAGRAFRRENSNFVEPSPVKGAIILTSGEDGLFHFTWKNRTTGVVDEVGSILHRRISLILAGLDSVPVGCVVRQGSSIRWTRVCPQVLFIQPEAFRKIIQQPLSPIDHLVLVLAAGPLRVRFAYLTAHNNFLGCIRCER